MIALLALAELRRWLDVIENPLSLGHDAFSSFSTLASITVAMAQ
ncbi:MAG: hypothetical protein WAV38_20175 [Xanthobacteraceae bacterium]